MSKYLDNNGLAYFWGKVKAYVDSHGGGGGASSISEISQTYSTTGNTNTYAVSNYTHGTDTLQVYLNGLKLIKGVDWQLANNNASVQLTNTIASGNTLEIVTLRLS